MADIHKTRRRLDVRVDRLEEWALETQENLETEKSYREGVAATCNNGRRELGDLLRATRTELEDLRQDLLQLREWRDRRPLERLKRWTRTNLLRNTNSST